MNVARKNRTDAVKRAAQYQGSSTVVRGAKRAPHEHTLSFIRGRQRCTTCPHVEPRPKVATNNLAFGQAFTDALGEFDKAAKRIGDGFKDISAQILKSSKKEVVTIDFLTMSKRFPEEISIGFNDSLPHREPTDTPAPTADVDPETLYAIVDKLKTDDQIGEAKSEPTPADIEAAVPLVAPVVVQTSFPTEQQTRETMILHFTNQPDSAMRDELVQTVQWLNLHGFNFKLTSKTNKSQLWAWIREARATVQDTNVPQDDA